jgi:tetratricopeptide (TPR) repeat protein
METVAVPKVMADKVGTEDAAAEAVVDAENVVAVSQQNSNAESIAGDSGETVNSKENEASNLKELGNACFKAGNFENALALYTSAIELCPNMALLYCNRSMCHASMNNWKLSVADAQRAVRLNETYEKAHFRLVKGLMELGRYKECGQNLLAAFKICGETKSLKELEAEYFAQSRTYLRPNPNDFEVKEELGDGNFSKIYKAVLKSTGAFYAIKVIEKATVTKMKRRHPNIDNEILMEKRVSLYYCSFVRSCC